MTRILSALGLLCLICLPGRAADDKLDLRWNLKKDQTLKYLLKHREVRVTEIGDQKLETATTIEYEWNMTVKDVDAAGVASVELKLDALRVDAAGKEFTFTYDSSRGGTESDDKYIKDLKHFYDQLRFATFRVQLKPDGRVGEVYGFDKLQGETTSGTQVAEFHGYWLHDDTFGWLLQMLVGVLPGKAEARDAKWKLPAPEKFKDLAATTGQLDLAFDKPNQGLERVRVGGTHTVDLNMPFVGSTLSGALKTSKLEGFADFDPKSGLVEGAELKIDYAGELKFGINDQPLKMKLTLKNEVTLGRKP